MNRPTTAFSASVHVGADHGPRQRLAAHPDLSRHGVELRPNRPFRIWTDDFSNMYSILK